LTTIFLFFGVFSGAETIKLIDNFAPSPTFCTTVCNGKMREIRKGEEKRRKNASPGELKLLFSVLL